MSRLVVTLLLAFLLTNAAELLASYRSALQLYKKGEFAASHAVLQKMLAGNKKDTRAKKLMIKVKRGLKKNKSKKLTEEAELKVEEGDFNAAYNLLEEAILLDTANRKARQMHLSIYEVLEVEKEPVAEGKVQMEFLSGEGKSLIGRKVKILLENGFTIVGMIVEDNKKAITVHSQSTNRSFEILKADIVMQSKARRKRRRMK